MVSKIVDVRGRAFIHVDASVLIVDYRYGASDSVSLSLIHA
jgi:hypothetical protein